ncbi:tyrosine-type recombinase/integrase [Singulisphaera sp. PoT]|uniref:tyrosine-type recombinase/integrase n=1 Tax=Singulisphaera sp. PoT TaxID=3411797 RepID=UPI003BF562C3
MTTLSHVQASVQPLAFTSIDLTAAFLSGRKPTTLRAYESDLEDFAMFAGAGSSGEAVNGLIALHHGQANGVALAYRSHMTERGLSSATVSRRLAALRSVVKLGRTLGLINWTLEVESPKAEAYRDTRGPGDDGWKAMLETAKREASTGDAKGVRDLALIRLLHDLGMRRGEVVALDLADVDLERGTVEIVGKGRTQGELLTLPEGTARALGEWIEIRGLEDGPLFTRLDRAAKEASRLTDTAVYQTVQALGKRAGLNHAVRPHGLRHQAITSALDATNGDIRSVQQFSRHSDPRTLLKYDDRRRDVAGAIARMIAD